MVFVHAVDRPCQRDSKSRIIASREVKHVASCIIMSLLVIRNKMLCQVLKPWVLELIEELYGISSLRVSKLVLKTKLGLKLWAAASNAMFFVRLQE